MGRSVSSTTLRSFQRGSKVDFSEVYIPRSEVLEAMAEESSRTSSKYFAASPVKTASTLKLAEEGIPLSKTPAYSV